MRSKLDANISKISASYICNFATMKWITIVSRSSRGVGSVARIPTALPASALEM
jgi:hypothetical protein